METYKFDNQLSMWLIEWSNTWQKWKGDYLNKGIHDTLRILITFKWNNINQECVWSCQVFFFQFCQVGGLVIKCEEHLAKFG
jgi:hypothetical protein